MKSAKLTVVLVTLLFLLPLLYPTYAQNSSTREKQTQTRPAIAQANPQNRANPELERKLVDLKERIASKTATLRTKLTAFKDQTKAKVVERLNDNMNKVNQNRTTQMTENLIRMEAVVAKVEAKMDEASAEGIVASPSAVTKLNQAKASITRTKNLVATQSTKDYSVNISTESAAKSQIQTTRNTLFRDLTAVHNQLKATHTLLREAVRAVMGSIGA